MSDQTAFRIVLERTRPDHQPETLEATFSLPVVATNTSEIETIRNMFWDLLGQWRDSPGQTWRQSFGGN